MEPIETQKPDPRDARKQARILRRRLGGIVSTHLTPDNINSYFDSALTNVIALVNDAATTYTAFTGTTLSGAELEDAAFNAFGLTSVPDILGTISGKQQIMAKISAVATARTRLVERIIIPTDKPEPPVVRPSDEGNDFETAKQTERLSSVLYLLDSSGIDIEDLEITEGVVTDNMLRRTSYKCVDINEIDKLILVCDEERNATFVLNKEQLREQEITTEEAMQMTKSEIKALLKENPKTGSVLIYSETWIPRLARQLFHNEDLADLPGVIMDELHPWRGFHIEEEQYFGTLPQIAFKLGVSVTSVVRKVNQAKQNGSEFATRRVVGLLPRAETAYEINEVYGLVADLMTTLDADTEGEWSGYAEIEGQHLSSITILSATLGITEKTITDRIKLAEKRGITFTNYPVRTPNGGFTPKGYALEEIMAIGADSRVASEEDWYGFRAEASDEGEVHVGTVNAISVKLGISVRAVKDHIARLERQGTPARSKNVFDLVGMERTGYYYEDISNFIASIKVAAEGEWIGFVSRGDRHYSTLLEIAARKGMNSNALKERFNNARKLGAEFTTTLINSVGGETINGYCFEEIDAIIETPISQENQVMLHGDWLGFMVEGETRIGTMKAIAEKLGILDSTLANRIEAAQGHRILTTRNILDRSGHQRTGYLLHEIEELLNNPVKIDKQVELKGEWVRFLEKDGLHFGTRNAIGQKLGLNPSTVQEMIEAAERDGFVFSQTSLIDLDGDSRSGYCLEELEGILNNKKKNMIATEGEWAGFVSANDTQHYGSKRAISARLGVSDSKLNRIINQFELSNRPIFDSNGVPRDGYCIEDFLPYL